MDCVKFSSEYIEEVKLFMTFVAQNKGKDHKIRYPCSHCLNIYTEPQENIFDHLLRFGMDQSYTRWIFHGEQIEFQFFGNRDRFSFIDTENDELGNDSNEDDDDDGIRDLLRDVDSF